MNAGHKGKLTFKVKKGIDPKDIFRDKKTYHIGKGTLEDKGIQRRMRQREEPNKETLGY